jgi:hypothetical protein
MSTSEIASIEKVILRKDAPKDTSTCWAESSPLLKITTEMEERTRATRPRHLPKDCTNPSNAEITKAVANAEIMSVVIDLV